jgi:hypothetical protein
MNGQILDIVFLILGVLIILFALAFGRKLQMDPISITIEKVGSLQMQFVPFLVVVGILFAGVGQFFRYKNYEESVSHLSEINRDYEHTRSELERFKTYEMMVQLVFHEPVDPKNLKAALAYKRLSDADFHQSNISLSPTASPSELTADIPRVYPGDKFFLVVDEVDPKTNKPGHAWRSPSVEVPVARLEMSSQ